MNWLRTLSFIALASAAMTARATTIDFDPPVFPTPSYSESGVTFSALGGGTVTGFTYGESPNGTYGLLAVDAANTAFVPILAELFFPASFVSVDIGDFDTDAEDLFLLAYDSADMLLASDAAFIAETFTGMVTLSVSANDIDHVVYGGIGAGDQSSVYTDNFTYDDMASTVPEPTAWAMMIAAAAILGTAMRRARGHRATPRHA